MRRFIQRALEKLEKMDVDSIRGIVKDIAGENELLEMVLESMTDGVVVTDRENRILLFNKSSERLVPFVSEDLMERYIWEVIGDREISGFMKDSLEAQERVRDREFVLDDGTGRIIACSIMPLVRDGTIQGNLVHLENVTEKNRREARLRRAESLAALTTLTAGVAHEIKNPLGSISIHIQLMQKEMKGKRMIPTQKFLKYLEIINEEVDRLNLTIADFLFAVRPMDTKMEPQDLGGIVRELLDFLKFELEEAKVELTLELQETPKILQDEKFMKHALLNLIKNAMAAMPKGGTLHITTRSNGDHVFLDIKDTGIGIPEENMRKIFEPYFTTKEFSSGLGLTLVFKIIKEHRGEILVNSKEGQGTTFSLSFPIPPPGEKNLIGFKGESDEI
ncbi:MAG TPA: ATP-binding protein [Spirochaetia bacterium]|nr:ATP-binding protein [Spirochaetia bacterium]